MDPDLERRLRQLGAKHQRLRYDLDSLRAELQELIVAAAQAGMPQAELVQITGYTRDRIRVISRDAGVEPMPQGRRRSRPSASPSTKDRR